MSGSLISLQTLRIRPSVLFALEEISFICWDHWRVLVTVMPKSLISITVASGDPLRWYSRFVGVFFLEIFKALHLGMLRHISQVSLQIESCVRSCWNENLSDGFSIILNSLESSANMATLESCLIHWGMSYRQGKAEGPILSLAEHRTRLVTSFRAVNLYKPVGRMLWNAKKVGRYFKINIRENAKTVTRLKRE